MQIAENYLDFLTCVMLADGVIQEEEKSAFLNILNRVGLSKKLSKKYFRILSGTQLIDRDDVISRVASQKDKEILVWIVRDAFLIADANGDVSDEEILLIKKLLEKSGVTPSRMKKIIQWGNEFIDHTKNGLKLFGK